MPNFESFPSIILQNQELLTTRPIIIILGAIFTIVAAVGTMGITSMTLTQTAHADLCVGDGCTITKINGHNSQHCKVKKGNIEECSN